MVSSSWGRVHTLDHIREFFAPDIAARIIDATEGFIPNDKLPGIFWSFEREGECWYWMARNRAAGTP